MQSANELIFKRAHLYECSHALANNMILHIYDNNNDNKYYFYCYHHHYYFSYE